LGAAAQEFKQAAEGNGGCNWQGGQIVPGAYGGRLFVHAANISSLPQVLASFGPFPTGRLVRIDQFFEVRGANLFGDALN
jgi:hypothetical protein